MVLLKNFKYSKNESLVADEGQYSHQQRYKTLLMISKYSKLRDSNRIRESYTT